MNYQIIRSPKGEEMVVVPRRDFERLRDAAEDRTDVRDAAALLRDLDEGREERVPALVADRLFAGEHPVKVWREHRGLTQTVLAARAGIGAMYVSQIETGRRRGSLEVVHRIAAALAVTPDDLSVNPR